MIHETASLLGEMDAEHAKSQNLMAELEALLAASSKLSSEPAKATPHFVSVEPLQQDEEMVEVEEFQDDEEVRSGPP